ncbi:hypothetical protein TNCV_1798211 [Trichonephila clavipes]|uniref:Uncharacterized protein n=1 Tax=Trichonephila clavipes TaxID=2585209 RepID=A0A8X6VLX7_TRICX|nr:hypothetical protein TNCV_1798211 [Trichonephila clavipes]
MAASSSSLIPTPLAHANNRGEGQPRGAQLQVIGQGHENVVVDAVTFPSYPRHALLKGDLVIWLAKEMFEKV